MPKYIAKAYLLHHGRVVPDGTEIELTKMQADRLGDKVEAAQPVRDYTVAELREQAHDKGIEGYYDMRKDELKKALGYTGEGA